MPRAKKNAVKAAPAAEAAAEVRKVRAPLPRAEELHAMIQTAAYFRAERDGFRQMADIYWKEAEIEIRSRFL